LEFYVELTLQIKKRFDFEDKFLKFASLFRPMTATSGRILTISEFTNLFPVLQHLNIDKVNEEWQLLSEVDELKSCNDSSFWEKLPRMKNDLGEPMFLNLFEVVKCILILPHSSASAERTFSKLFIIKTDKRNRLKIETISNILSIKEYISFNSKGQKFGNMC
jgi:hypothetical protein